MLNRSDQYLKQRKEYLAAAKRKELLKRASKLSFVPGHEPDFENMDIEHLETFVKLTESMSRVGREEKEWRELIKKASAFHVPGHGPNFEKMTNEQIENHIYMIEETFRMAFDEDE